MIQKRVLWGLVGVFVLVMGISHVNAGEKNAIGTVKMKFFGSSTIHDFEGEAPQVPLYAVATTDTLKISATIAVQTMDTDNSSRDENMREVLDATQYPIMEGSVVLPLAKMPKKGDRIPCTFKLHGKTVRYEAVVESVDQKKGKVYMKAVFKLSLKDINVTPPTVAFVIKVDDIIKVALQFTLKKEVFTP